MGKKGILKELAGNTPNILSAIRLCMVPAFALFYFSHYENGKIYAVIVYITAVCTDVLDGYIARHFHLVTNLGRILDPLADKLMTLTVLTSLTINGVMPLWITSVFYVKELLMISGGTFIHKKIKMDMPPSNVFGKAAAASLFVLCASIMIFRNMGKTAVTVLTVITICLAVCALVSYILTYIGIMRKRNRKV